MVLFNHLFWPLNYKRRLLTVIRLQNYKMIGEYKVDNSNLKLLHDLIYGNK